MFFELSSRKASVSLSSRYLHSLYIYIYEKNHLQQLGFEAKGTFMIYNFAFFCLIIFPSIYANRSIFAMYNIRERMADTKYASVKLP
jgi:hypothetical protein